MPRFERDLVEEGLGRELVGDEADAAHRRGAHTGVLVDLLDELMGHVIALEVGAEHQDEVLLAGAFVAHRIEERRDPVAD